MVLEYISTVISTVLVKPSDSKDVQKLKLIFTQNILKVSNSSKFSKKFFKMNLPDQAQWPPIPNGTTVKPDKVQEIIV